MSIDDAEYALALAMILGALKDSGLEDTISVVVILRRVRRDAPELAAHVLAARVWQRVAPILGSGALTDRLQTGVTQHITARVHREWERQERLQAPRRTPGLGA